MSKFNTARTSGRTQIKVESAPTAKTLGYGAAAYAYGDAKSELFSLAVLNFVGENTYYESDSARDTRFEGLVRQVAVQDPVWMVQFLTWLRNDANMRSSSLVGAMEATKAMLDAGIPGSRQAIAAVLRRADEPGEALAYWISRHGKKIPMPVKRGIADGANRLYNERSMLKYDTPSHAVRFADVIELTHPDPGNGWKSDLYRYALENRHKRGTDIPESLTMIAKNASLRARVSAGEYGIMLDSERLGEAGMTWEDALSLVGSKVDKAKLWEAMIPSMGYMALLRNLRNFDEAGISPQAAAWVAAKLQDPDEVARSRQFPYRFVSAHKQVASLRYSGALEEALRQSLGSLPELPGRSLILVDTSGSMDSPIAGKHSKMNRNEAARIFGCALAVRNPDRVDLYGFGDRPYQAAVRKGADILPTMDNFRRQEGAGGHGTNIGGALRQTFAGHDRVFIISDMQTMSNLDDYNGDGWYRNAYNRTSVDSLIPADVPVYGFNLGGYNNTQIAAGKPNRHEFSGLGDSIFKAIPLLERGENVPWPWEN